METILPPDEQFLAEYDRLRAPPRAIKVGDRVRVTLTDEETLDFTYAGVGRPISGHTGVVIGICPGILGGKFPTFYRILMLDCLIAKWRRSLVTENVLHLAKSELEFVEEIDVTFFQQSKIRLLKLLPILPTYRYRDKANKKEKRYVGLHYPYGFVIYRSIVIGTERQRLILDLGNKIYYCHFSGPDLRWLARCNQTGQRVKVHWTRLLDPSLGLLGTVRLCKNEAYQKAGGLSTEGVLIV